MTVPTPGPPLLRPDACGATRFVPAEGGGFPGRLGPCERERGHLGPHEAGSTQWGLDRRADLLDAIAQASITIQRSVAELEQLPTEPEAERTRCESMAPGAPRRCQRVARHSGRHTAGHAQWDDPPSAKAQQLFVDGLGMPIPTELRYCGHVAHATGVEVKCELEADHAGMHRRGEMSWPGQALNLGLPHSRACGIRQHPHGPACAVDCPSCVRGYGGSGR